MNLVSEANKLGLSLPIGLGISSPYYLTTSTLRDHPQGRLRSKVHIVTPDAQTKPSIEEIPRITLKSSKEEDKRKEKVYWMRNL